MSNPRFIHLRIHSDYSMINGLIKIDMLIKRAKYLHMPSLAITDFTNLYGLIKFYSKACDAGIKPIIGADFFIKSETLINELSELTILAANNIGYKNLILLISNAYKHGYDIKGPFINYNLLIKYNEGLILISRSCKGDISKHLMRGDISKMEKCIDFYESYFKNRHYLEIVRTGRFNEENYINSIVKIAMNKNLSLVATNDVCFLDKNDFYSHEVRVAIHDGFMLDDSKRKRNYSPQQYMRSEEEMCELFSDLPGALTNSVEIAIRCNVTIKSGEYFLPKFPTGKLSTQNYLIKCSKEGLEERLINNNIFKENRLVYDQRLKIELKMINHMGFPGYFLIVMEFIRWSKKNDVPVGPGRGSGAGSLVAYALKITDIDPLKFDLLFERFLNPERISMPDFDIDFCMEKRDLVINHVAEKYGRSAVSQIITFGTLTAKAVIRDVGRVLGYPYSFVNRISKLVPIDPGITLKQAIIINTELRSLYNTDEEVKIIINMACKLEGIIRNVGKHAGGIVISPTKITDFMPLYYDNEGNNPVTQFDKDDVEYTGLVKFDFLGLRTLTIIHNTLKIINARRSIQNLSSINISSISLKDKKSFDILQRSETTAVFQLESRGMKDLIKRLKPDCFEDIIALIALFRPGPLQSGMVDNFINRKHGKEIISYPDVKWQHPLLRSVLESTYGIILYQEQVMKIAQILAGYTLGEADILRRAMGKKKPKEMIKQRLIFKSGAERNGIKSELSMKIFDIVEKFAGYGFNKSHSAAYALLSYQTLWLKSHYPSEFMSAVMTADMDNTEKIAGLIDECLRMGIKILPPNINTSKYHFHVNENNEIVYGFGAIKGIGKKNIDTIIQARKKNGKFNGIFDLCARTDIKKFNRCILEKLIMSGTFDSLEKNRAKLISSINDVLKATDQYIKNKCFGQYDMFGNITQKTIEKSYNIVPWSNKKILKGEYNTLGLYLTGHPITQYLKEIRNYSDGTCIKDVYYLNKGKIITIAGLVLSVRITINKCGNQIGYCTLDDSSGQLDVILFTDVLEKYKYLLKIDNILIVNGRINFDIFKGNLKIIAYELMNINEAREKYVCGLTIFLIDSEVDNKFLNYLRLSLEPYRYGNIPVYLYYQKRNVRVKLFFDKTWYINLNDSLLSDLKKIIGNNEFHLEFNKKIKSN